MNQEKTAWNFKRLLHPLPLVSGTSGAIHGGSSPLERTFCWDAVPVALTAILALFGHLIQP